MDFFNKTIAGLINCSKRVRIRTRLAHILAPLGTKSKWNCWPKKSSVDNFCRKTILLLMMVLFMCLVMTHDTYWLHWLSVAETHIAPYFCLGGLQVWISWIFHPGRVNHFWETRKSFPLFKPTHFVAILRKMDKLFWVSHVSHFWWIPHLLKDSHASCQISLVGALLSFRYITQPYSWFFSDFPMTWETLLRCFIVSPKNIYFWTFRALGGTFLSFPYIISD